MNRAEKQQEIEFLTGSLKKAQLALCVDYRGLTVAQITTLRKSLRQSGATSRVVKNKLAKISAKKVLDGGDSGSIEKFVALFREPSFVVFAENDPVAPTKALTEFAKTTDKLKVKGAWLDGEYLDVAGVTNLAKLPGRTELLGKLLALINAPATQLVGLLQAPGGQVVRLLEAQRKNIEAKA